jgi:hypothetical protein
VGVIVLRYGVEKNEEKNLPKDPNLLGFIQTLNRGKLRRNWTA